MLNSLKFLRRELRALDRMLLEQEVERLAREKRLSLDRWLLS